MQPEPTRRLRFREMGAADLDDIALMLGDAEVMRFYPEPKTREESAEWIAWNQRNYVDLGFGLWVIEAHDGDFVGDCGLTMQEIEGEQHLEIGWHVVGARQGRGLATEAARAVVDAARQGGHPRLVAIIRPENAASRRVAEKIGMRLAREVVKGGEPAVVLGLELE